MYQSYYTDTTKRRETASIMLNRKWSDLFWDKDQDQDQFLQVHWWWSRSPKRSSSIKRSWSFSPRSIDLEQPWLVGVAYLAIY